MKDNKQPRQIPDVYGIGTIPGTNAQVKMVDQEKVGVEIARRTGIDLETVYDVLTAEEDILFEIGLYIDISDIRSREITNKSQDFDEMSFAP